MGAIWEHFRSSRLPRGRGEWMELRAHYLCLSVGMQILKFCVETIVLFEKREGRLEFICKKCISIFQYFHLLKFISLRRVTYISLCGSYFPLLFIVRIFLSLRPVSVIMVEVMGSIFFSGNPYFSVSHLGGRVSFRYINSNQN